MKKIIYLLIACTIAFVGCTPLEDVYSELDDKDPITTDVIGDGEYVLTEDDYKALKLDNEYFVTEDQAKGLLPALLKEKYNFWTKGSSVSVTFNLESEFLNMQNYTLSEDDYKAIKLNYFSDLSEFESFFEYKNMPRPDKGTVLALTYKARPTKLKSEEYTLTDSDYDLVGDGKYKNFNLTKDDKKKILGKIEKILLNNKTEAKNNDIFEVFYNAYYGGGKKGVEAMFVKLELDIPSTTKVYTLKDADYELVGNGKYKNFDVRSGKSEETIAARVEKINTILLKNITNAKKDDTYYVTYKIFDGSNGFDSALVEFDGTKWELSSKTVTKKIKEYKVEPIDRTSNFVYKNKWEAPYKFNSDDYQVMGQKFGSFDLRFDDRKEEGLRKMAIFLAKKYPFDGEGDYRSLQFVEYVGGGKTEISSLGFILQNNMWTSNIPNTIPTTIQFGFDGTAWVPDNTIKYTLTTADFELVGNGKYSNFDVRDGKDEKTVEARVAKISTILLNNFPDAEEGQKYLVTYAIWNGSAGTMSTKVIKEGNKYVQYKE